MSRRPARLDPYAIPGDVPEAAWQQTVEDMAKLYGWLRYHTRDSRRSVGGFPDLILIRGTRLVVAELKTATGKVTAAQREWLDAFAATGAETHVWRPADVRLVQSVLMGVSPTRP